MTPEQRRDKIQHRIDNAGFSVNEVAYASGYTGLSKYLEGTKATDNKIYDVELALGRLERKSK